MKTRILFFPILCILAAALGLQAQDKGSKSAATETELELQMEEINLAYRKLNRQIADSTKNADSLKQIATLQKHATASTKLEPKKKSELPAAEQAKFVADYQAKMKEFADNVAKVETALKAGKNDEAASALKMLKQNQDEGHKMFKKDKKAKTAEAEKK